ncbi:MAG: pantetheine-phosphate adenylyltransferase, partial [Nitrospirae bacterium]
MRIGVYPGTFDPITNGHVDLINRGLRLFDKIYVAVAANPQKHPVLALDERVELVRLATKETPRVEVEPFHGLLVDFVRQRGAHAVIRGLRAVSDFEFELQMALMNRNLDQSVETVFLMPSQEYIYLTSTIIKEVARLGGDLAGLVHPEIARRLG